MAYLTESPSLSSGIFIMLRDLIHERLGLFYEEEKKEIMRDRLAPLVAEANLDSFLDYYYLLKYQDNNQDEWWRVQTALAVRETYFWREADQIRLAAEEIIPRLQKHHPGKPVRVWHAACASGEEPYSLAIALAERGINWEGQIEIIGTDFDREALRLARNAVYRERSFRAIAPALREKYFNRLEDGTSRLADDIRRAVNFQYLNLVDQAGMALMQDFDVIFCRNVFIYFSDHVIGEVSNHFYRALNNPGFLFLGASESLLRIPTQFRLTEMLRCFVYLKGESV